jgi:hypothetical protein
LQGDGKTACSRQALRYRTGRGQHFLSRFEIQEAERRMVGLGRAIAASITALIIILLVAGFVAGIPGGFLLGWLVFR